MQFKYVPVIAFSQRHLDEVLCAAPWQCGCMLLLIVTTSLQGNAQRAQTDSDKIFSEMLQAVERWHAEIRQLIQANLQASMTQVHAH